MVILGLDCATKTGWSLYDTISKTVIESGVEDFKKKRGESNGMVFIKFRKWISDMLTFAPQIGLVIYEQAHHKGGAATNLLVGLTTRVEEACDEHEIQYSTVRTTTLKLEMTGHGNAGKPEMISASEKFLGRRPIDDNEADAVLISVYGAKMYGA